MILAMDRLLHNLASQATVRVLVFSDSHGQTDFMTWISDQHPEADLILHLGDHGASLADLALLLKKPVLGVYGNCDGHFARHLPAQQYLKLSNKQVFLTHGHRFGVKQQLSSLLEAGSNKPYFADVILFGHTHQYLENHILVNERPVLLLNPGSARHSFSGIPASALLLNLDQSGISSELLLDQI